MKPALLSLTNKTITAKSSSKPYTKRTRRTSTRTSPIPIPEKTQKNKKKKRIKPTNPKNPIKSINLKNPRSQKRETAIKDITPKTQTMR